jgi:hypothetical protein
MSEREPCDIWILARRYLGRNEYLKMRETLAGLRLYEKPYLISLGE